MFGLFDWIWNIFYAISKSMYGIIDNLLAVANMLCGIEPIRYAGAEMDFVSFLMHNQAITYAFVGAVLVSIALVAVFAVFAILRTIASEKVEKTPAQIAVQVAKTLLIFLFIPAAMTVLIFFTGRIMSVLYQATTGGSPDGLGRFLAGAFGQDARHGGVPEDFFLSSDFNYASTSNVKKYLDLSEYNYFFSYLGSLVIIICLGLTLLMFVDRAISIVILFVFAPISLSTSILDDGARFKLWRDQFITKFLVGYGCIIAINIYALIIAAITNSALVFFDNSVLNNFMKIVIIVGGGVSMNRVMALVGNLISPGAGSNELRDNAIATSGFRRAVGGVFGGAFGATRGAVNFLRDTKNQGLGTALGRATGFRTNHDYAMDRARLGAGSSSGAANHKKAGYGEGENRQNRVKDAIDSSKKQNNRDSGAKVNPPKGGNQMIEMHDMSNANANNPGVNMVNNSVNNALMGNKKKGDK